MKKLMYIEKDASDLQRSGKNKFIGLSSATVCNRPVAERKKKGAQAGASHNV